jgi:GDP/UDP-N,N'-diacetylbacillosamine 2-epimerase (hydrolysing)
LLRELMHAIRDDDSLGLQLIVTGTHLSPEFGLTVSEIEADGFTVDRRIEILLSSDTAAGTAKSMGLGLIGFGEAFRDLRPEIVVILGDRFEAFAAAAAAMVACVPIAHLHGGEVTEAAFDEMLRHAITKLSHLHFVAAEEYGRRVVQLGEQPERVHVVGSLGVDAALKVPSLSRVELERELGVELGSRSLMITFHPSTLEPGGSVAQVDELLAALDGLQDTTLLFTMPNADPEGRAIAARLGSFVSAAPRRHLFASLGQRRYFSCLRVVDGVVGNSSSGLIEAPSFGIGTVNIGDRQKGRLRADSVIDCRPDRASIAAALTTLYSPSFRQSLGSVRNPYGAGGAVEAILRILRQTSLQGGGKKTFFDLPAYTGELGRT